MIFTKYFYYILYFVLLPVIVHGSSYIKGINREFENGIGWVFGQEAKESIRKTAARVNDAKNRMTKIGKTTNEADLNSQRDEDYPDLNGQRDEEIASRGLVEWFSNLDTSTQVGYLLKTI